METLVPKPQLSILFVFIFFFVYFIGAISEEIGWSGYAIDPLQDKYGALKASIILGIIWTIWHIIPYYHKLTKVQTGLFGNVSALFFYASSWFGCLKYWQKQAFCDGAFSPNDQY